MEIAPSLKGKEEWENLIKSHEHKAKNNLNDLATAENQGTFMLRSSTHAQSTKPKTSDDV